MRRVVLLQRFLLAYRLLSTYPSLCWKVIHVSPKIRVLPSWTLSETLDLETSVVNLSGCWVWQTGEGCLSVASLSHWASTMGVRQCVVWSVSGSWDLSNLVVTFPSHSIMYTLCFYGIWRLKKIHLVFALEFGVHPVTTVIVIVVVIAVINWCMTVASGHILMSSFAAELPTLPFFVLKTLFDQTPLTTDDGVVLRRMTLDIGVIHLVLACLSVLGHHAPRQAIPGFHQEVSFTLVLLFFAVQLLH